MEGIKKYARILLNILIPLLLAYLLFSWGPKLLGFFMPFIIGWLISLIANPLVRLLERRLKIVRKHSSVVIVVLVLGLVVSGVYFLSAKLISEGIKFIGEIPELYEGAAGEIDAAFDKFGNIFRLLPVDAQNVLVHISENISTYVGSFVEKIGEPTVQVAGNVAKGIPSVLINIIFTILFSYFLIAERDNFMTSVKKVLPPSINEKATFVSGQIKRMAGGYLLAQMKIMLVVAVILLVGFFVLRINYALFLSLLIAFLDFLPVFGTGTVLIPWALLKVFAGEYYMAAGLAITYVATQATRQMIQPKIVGDTMGIPPLLTLFLLYVGYKISGISGMILAVPAGILVLEFYKAGFFDSFIAAVKTLIADVNRFRRGDE